MNTEQIDKIEKYEKEIATLKQKQNEPQPQNITNNEINNSVKKEVNNNIINENNDNAEINELRSKCEILKNSLEAEKKKIENIDKIKNLTDLIKKLFSKV